MPSSLELMHMQVGTLFRLDADGRMTGINEPGDQPAPRVFLGRTAEGNVWRFRRDLQVALVRELEAILESEPMGGDLPQRPATFDRLCSALSVHEPISNIWQGPAWYVPSTVQPTASIDVVAVTDDALLETSFPNGPYREPCFAVVSDGVAVAVCESARTSEHAAEAGVATADAFRGRGYASAAVAAWARAVRASGRVPLYSTSWDNIASQAVARRLGLVLYGVDFHIT
jgi:RimJ/RimL family protein N-acetyltransferase